jgi:hypothetical protein
MYGGNISPEAVLKRGVSDRCRCRQDLVRREVSCGHRRVDETHEGQEEGKPPGRSDNRVEFTQVMDPSRSQ